MTTVDIPFLLKIYKRSYFYLRRFTGILTRIFTGIPTAVFSGCWLGLIKREHLHLLDYLYYCDPIKDGRYLNYLNDEHNLSGLFSWEKNVINKYFDKNSKILIISAGAGREVIALHKMGFKVDCFECHDKLAKYGNELLKKERIPVNIISSVHDGCPETGKEYDGVIVGWAAYMLIQGRLSRISFLKKIREQLKKNSPVLLSFYYDNKNKFEYKITYLIGNIFRIILNRERIELGDDLRYSYVHFFTKKQINDELDKAGFKLEFYSTHKYGHAIGIVS